MLDEEEETRSTKEHIMQADLSQQHLNLLNNTTIDNLFDFGSSSLLVEPTFKPKGLFATGDRFIPYRTTEEEIQGTAGV